MIKPCMDCHPDLKDSCERLLSLKKSIKGLGIKALTISCRKLQDYFPPGTRVIAKIYNSDIEDILGTVSHFHSRTKRLVVFLDDTPGVREVLYDYGPEELLEGHDIVKIKPRNLTKIDEPLRATCSECGRPEGHENTEKWHCWKCNGEPPPVDDIGIGVYF